MCTFCLYKDPFVCTDVRIKTITTRKSESLKACFHEIPLFVEYRCIIFIDQKKEKLLFHTIIKSAPAGCFIFLLPNKESWFGGKNSKYLEVIELSMISSFTLNNDIIRLGQRKINATLKPAVIITVTFTLS